MRRTLVAIASGSVALFALVGTPLSADDAAPRRVETPAKISVEFTKTRDADSPAPRGDDVADREALGRLVFARVSIDADDRPIREVLTAFARAAHLNLLPFYESPDRPSPRLSIYPEHRVSLFLQDVDGRAALEAIAAQAGGDVTWQVQRGVIEFGPRAALAREDARRTKAYEAVDLGLEAPYFKSPLNDNTRPQVRLKPKDVIADLVRTVSEQCEPDAFKPAPPPTDDEIKEGTKQPATQHVAPSAPTTNPRPLVNSTASRNLDPELGPIYVLGRWAQIHVKDATLVVTAPDFVHRAINGYPEPIPPKVQ